MKDLMLFDDSRYRAPVIEATHVVEKIGLLFQSSYKPIKFCRIRGARK